MKKRNRLASPRRSRPSKARVSPAEVAGAVDRVRAGIEAAGPPIQRIDCTPDNVEQGLAKLVLSLLEMVRQLLERQAIRRMEAGSLSDPQVEEMGLALMRLEQKVHQLAAGFGLKPQDLNLELGPLGSLLER